MELERGWKYNHPAACQKYVFHAGKEPIDMTGYESTLLAGIPNAPSVYSLTANPDLAKQRQQYVIQQMVRYGYISEDEGKELSQ